MLYIKLVCHIRAWSGSLTIPKMLPPIYITTPIKEFGGNKTGKDCPSDKLSMNRPMKNVLVIK